MSVTRITGEITISEAVDYVKERAAKSEPNGNCLPVLVDASEAVEHSFLINDMELLARLAAEIHQNNGHRREAFVAVHDQNVGLLALFKKFSINGHNQKVFDDLEAATIWLKSED